MRPKTKKRDGETPAMTAAQHGTVSIYGLNGTNAATTTNPTVASGNPRRLQERIDAEEKKLDVAQDSIIHLESLGYTAEGNARENRTFLMS